jgi:hypothetical protein
MSKRKIHVPMVLKNPIIRSHALKVHPSQVAEANEVSRAMGCGTPFGADGMFEASRSQTKRYVEELNRRRGEGEARIVNFDGGYGDPT